MEREQIVAAVVAAARGPLIGRVRLQKTVYLLDRVGLNSGFDYEYHHYGPYSRDLDNATADGKAFGLIEEKFEHRQSDGTMYSIFSMSQVEHIDPHAYGDLGGERARALVIDWLWREERCADWRGEITRRKGAKTRHGRLDRAVDLLRSLGLPPPEPVSVGRLK